MMENVLVVLQKLFLLVTVTSLKAVRSVVRVQWRLHGGGHGSHLDSWLRKPTKLKF